MLENEKKKEKKKEEEDNSAFHCGLAKKKLKKKQLSVSLWTAQWNTEQF